MFPRTPGLFPRLRIQRGAQLVKLFKVRLLHPSTIPDIVRTLHHHDFGNLDKRGRSHFPPVERYEPRLTRAPARGSLLKHILHRNLLYMFLFGFVLYASPIVGVNRQTFHLLVDLAEYDHEMILAKDRSST
jgi:hypothetical protein